MNEKKFRK
uniref:Uncharacterized protein n=1 Tax=Moniliophthora roreri TaxID=221103 RepID=A0A0W0G1S4_MONRR